MWLAFSANPGQILIQTNAGSTRISITEINNHERIFSNNFYQAIDL